MEIVHSFNDIQRPLTLTLGNYDGVHLGHQAVLKEIIHQSDHPTLLTFKNHPTTILRPDRPAEQLTSLTQKLELFEAFGIQTVILIPFTKEFANLSPENFLKQLQPHHLILGYDASFGKGATGNATTILSLAAKLSFEVSYLPPLTIDGTPVSSSRIRSAIASGDLSLASRLLGRPYVIDTREETSYCLPPHDIYEVLLNGEPTSIDTNAPLPRGTIEFNS